jgi:hypothetical protein
MIAVVTSSRYYPVFAQVQVDVVTAELKCSLYIYNNYNIVLVRN